MARWELVMAALVAWAWCGGAQLVEPPRCPNGRCAPGRSGQNEYPYTVDGFKLLIEYTDSGYFALKCSENLTLDNSALPRFKSELRVNKVQLKDCPPPRDSYADVLSTLNVVPLNKLKLINAGNLTGEHLAGLKDILAFELIGAELAPRALAALQGLRHLFLDHVRLPPDELRHLPTSLEMLELMRMGINLTAAVLEKLPRLVNVTVRDSHNLSVALTGSVKVLALQMPAVHVPSTLSPALRSLTVFNWDERWPEPWTTCALHKLHVRDVTAEALPAYWVNDCKQLLVLRVEDGMRLRTLDATSLRGATELQELHLTSCALTTLPSQLLDDAVNLTLLNLSGNLLTELPSGLFARTRFLQTLNLAKNRLKTSVFTSLLAVTSLTTLQLSYNDLRDSCGSVSDTVRGTSHLQHLIKMTNLYLRKTNASLICRDWREKMPLLKTLDLAWNNFSTITYADLQFGANVKVDLSGNNVSKLYYTRHDYALVTAGVEENDSRALVSLDETLACDCNNYWAARALRERASHVHLRAVCANGRALRDVSLDSLVCAAPELCARAAPGCACAWRDSGRPQPARVLRLHCERANLTRLAQVLAPLDAALRRYNVTPNDYDWQLHLAHNRIAHLTAADLPKHLSVLDLSNNLLSVLSVETARALVVDERRRVSLAHNPLICDCSAADVLTELRVRQSTIQDYLNATCSDLSPLSAVSVAACPPARGPGVGAVAAGIALGALLVAAALGGLLWHPTLRLRLKAALHQRGWLFTADEPEDDERRFDVFLSFSHGDERFVREELVARLESGPAPYLVCVHYRDWVPGGWIPAQIAASVRASRRTVAVVSCHFLRSAWARAEFQEAYALALRDARPRLVVVLLDEPAALPLDDKLRRYLATNTYLRWGDPWFWQKLRLALPRARGPKPPAPSAPPTPPAPPAPAPPVPPAPPAHISVEVTNPPTPEVSSVPPSSSSSLSSTPTCSSSSANSAIEMDPLVKPTCGAQYTNEMMTFATPLQV